MSWIERAVENWRELIAEPVVRDCKNRYQWSVDAVLINKKYKKVIIIDNKTWGIAKNNFDLPNKYRKAYDKIKKVSLQLSLYWETYRQKWYEIESIWVLVLHKEGAFPYSLPIYTTEELNVILSAFELQTKTLEEQIININLENMFKLEILHPTVQYWNVRLECNLEELDNWDTIPETLEKMCKTAKVVANEMKKE